MQLGPRDVGMLVSFDGERVGLKVGFFVSSKVGLTEGCIDGDRTPKAPILFLNDDNGFGFMCTKRGREGTCISVNFNAFPISSEK